MLEMIYFDTLQYAEKLKAAGIPEAQAKVFTEVQRDALSECLDSTLATKTQLSAVKSELKTEIAEVKRELKADIAEVRTEVKLLKWMMGFVLTCVGALILKAFF